MVGVAQDDLGAQGFEFLGRDGFDRTQGAHRHEDGGFDVASRGGEHPCPGPAASGGDGEPVHEAAFDNGFICLSGCNGLFVYRNFIENQLF